MKSWLIYQLFHYFCIFLIWIKLSFCYIVYFLISIFIMIINKFQTLKGIKEYTILEIFQTLHRVWFLVHAACWDSSLKISIVIQKYFFSASSVALHLTLLSWIWNLSNSPKSRFFNFCSIQFLNVLPCLCRIFSFYILLFSYFSLISIVHRIILFHMFFYCRIVYYRFTMYFHKYSLAWPLYSPLRSELVSRRIRAAFLLSCSTFHPLNYSHFMCLFPPTTSFYSYIPFAIINYFQSCFIIFSVNSISTLMLLPLLCYV